jgi:hypothetical protein
MKLISTKETAELLSMTRETVGKKLSGMTPQEGPKNAKLYPSDRAIRLCLGKEEGQDGDHIDYAEAQRLLTVKRGEQIDLQNEVLRKERIPIETAEQVNDRVFSNVAGLLKGHIGKQLDETLIGDIFTELRNVGAALR